MGEEDMAAGDRQFFSRSLSAPAEARGREHGRAPAPEGPQSSEVLPLPVLQDKAWFSLDGPGHSCGIAAGPDAVQEKGRASTSTLQRASACTNRRAGTGGKCMTGQRARTSGG